MKIGKRVNLATNDILDLRFLADTLQGQYDHVYITFTTIEEKADAWQEGGDFFLHIPLPPNAVMDGEPIDFRKKIIEHLPMLKNANYQELIAYIKQRMPTDYVPD